ncbi:MAG TPA: helix-turn-helix domain-containing protein, partial [Polyangiaceae bacterium]|nr:helix-turn-helix domain-containing protein [Polyangiaceae bacterium]
HARRAWPHFLPFAVYTLVTLPRLLSPGAAKLALATGARVDAATPWFDALDWGVELQGLAYLTACLVVVRRHRAALEREFSNLERRQVRWLGQLLGALLVLWLGSMAAHATRLPLLIYVHIPLTLVVYVIAYLNAVEPELFETAPAARPDAAPASRSPALALSPASRSPAPAPSSASHSPAPVPSPAFPAGVTPEPSTDQPAALPAASSPVWQAGAAPEATAGPPFVEAATPAEAAAPARYQKAKLKDEQARDIAERLRACFDRERPYLDPDFALATLAERLDASPHHISQVLNERFGQSFYDYVNSCRVEELKRRLLDPRFAAEKVLTIGLDCGFSSKSALNANFKKWAGMTPTEFRQRGGQAARPTRGDEADARG